MTKPKFWLILFGSILLLSIGTLLLFPQLMLSSAVAEIYQDGVLVETVNLNTLTEPYEIRLSSGDRENVILAEKGQISMQSANCPDRLCVHQGAIKNSFYPIVCLPNKVTIKLRNTDTTTPDAIVTKAGA